MRASSWHSARQHSPRPAVLRTARRRDRALDRCAALRDAARAACACACCSTIVHRRQRPGAVGPGCVSQRRGAAASTRFRSGCGSFGARLTASLFDFGRVNHRMHNKLFIADGVMAVAGGRNIGDEYFMVARGRQLHRPRRVRRRPGGAAAGGVCSISTGTASTLYPLQSIVRRRATWPDERRAPLRRWTGPLAHTRRRLPPPRRAPSTCSGSSACARGASQPARSQLIWAQAEAFADSPEKVDQPHSASWLARERGARRRPCAASLMSELPLARQEVLVSSPYLVPEPPR